MSCSFSQVRICGIVRRVPDAAYSFCRLGKKVARVSLFDATARLTHGAIIAIRGGGFEFMPRSTDVGERGDTRFAYSENYEEINGEGYSKTLYNSNRVCLSKNQNHIINNFHMTIPLISSALELNRHRENS